MKIFDKIRKPRTPFEDPTRVQGTVCTDPFGSYTGCPLDPEELPVQDADDL